MRTDLLETSRALGVDMSIILKWFLKKQDVRIWTGSNWLRIGSSGRLL
jgi:hypothetical protein